MKFPAELLKRFIRNPVLAAYAIMGVELDVFQEARLKYYWHVPQKIDESGWGTGKTIVDFIYVNLRCILFDNHDAAVYFPIFQTGKDEWWKYFTKIRHPVFEAQFLVAHGKLGEWKEPGCYRREFKNGSRILMPAPSFLQDSQNQASRSFNTLVVEEYTVASAKGDGIDELIGRVRSPNFNKRHPHWGNHILLSGHAEDKDHPSEKYVQAYKDSIRGQHTTREATRKAIFSFCFLDWTPIFAKKYREDDTINEGRRTLSRDAFRQKYFGIRTRSGKGWYSKPLIERVMRINVLPQIYRKHDREYFVQGVDIAPGQSHKADSCAFVDWRISQVPKGTPEEITYLCRGVPFHVSPVFGHFLKNKSARQISGFIHGRHRSMGYSRIVMDPGGGGAFVMKELLEPKQIIHNVETLVTPICSNEELNLVNKQAILVLHKRGSELDRLWHPHYLQSDEGIIEAAHTVFREWFEACYFHAPSWIKNRSMTEMSELSEKERYSLVALDQCWSQLIKVRVKADAAGKMQRSRRGFKMFESPIKKDGAYALLYGYLGVKLWFWELENDELEEEEEGVLVS